MVQRESLFLISIKRDFKSKNLKMRKQVLILNLNQKLIANLVKRVFLTDLLLNLHVHLVQKRRYQSLLKNIAEER